ncbi:MAG: DNA mismatch repair endonuclease MutL [Methanothrix sp.]|nr:DNA mismatch repair endonuclease MutL [Methanothrix sp.]
MARIKHLDEDTINKIAAGEVIERPASAVKELVENSVDAGARRIIVEVNDGGKSLIRVTDDGCGIEPDDLPLAFMKHATSKIRNARDLERIKTLGFRGEALASIASVSRCVEVRTKTPGSLSGTYMRMESGKIAEIKDVGCAVGTTITVWDLFYNVPARRKHLKGREAELVHITNTITEMAIINYTIAFELFSGSRTIFKSTRASCWDDVLLRIFGLKTFKSMAPLQIEGRGWRLTGTAGDPFSARSSPDRIFIFVNGRAVSSRALAGALRDAYRNVIPQAKSPVAVLSLVIDPELVDVNVHPAKREIRLLREDEVCSALSQAVAQALVARAQGSQAAPEQSPHVSPHPSRAMITSKPEQVTLPLHFGLDDAVEETAAEMRRPRVKILGQILDLYIVAEGEKCLMLIDQHAAAERIRFEQLQERYINRKIRQELAVPITIDLSPSEQILMESWKETLSDIGFEIVPFGGNTISVRSVPALGKRLESAEAIHDILSDLFAVGKVGQDSTNRDEILRLLACKGSIKSGKELGMAEMQRLLEELYECQNPLTCPHGRPVAVTIDQSHLERLFARR